MTDLAIAFDSTAMRGDLCVVDGDLALDHGLRSLTTLSLMTDARATPAEAPDSLDDLRGWWGDALSDRPLGSRLWTMARAKATRENRLRAEDIASDALSWLVEDGIAGAVEVTGTRTDGVGSGATLGLAVTITRADGGPERFVYDLLWEAMT